MYKFVSVMQNNCL